VINNEAGAISGRFTNLPEGGSITAGGFAFRGTYVGGDGNDLVLTVIPEPCAAVSMVGGMGILALRRRRR
jgi:hypothetical protein